MKLDASSAKALETLKLTAGHHGGPDQLHHRPGHLQTAGDTAVLEGTRVLISGTAAGLLNKPFKTDAVKADMLVGIAKITVNTK